jgi:hypothetical protein
MFFCTQQLRFFFYSGASHQMSDQRSYFSSMTTIQKGVWLVKGIGEVNLPVFGQGSIDFPATVDGKQYPGQLPTLTKPLQRKLILLLLSPHQPYFLSNTIKSTPWMLVLPVMISYISSPIFVPPPMISPLSSPFLKEVWKKPLRHFRVKQYFCFRNVTEQPGSPSSELETKYEYIYFTVLCQ